MTRAIPILLWAVALSAQTKPAEPLPTGLVLRFDVDLVQVDAVVTRHDGSRVAGLTAADFEVLQDGKPQTITHFSFVSETAAKGDIRSTGLERSQVQRTIVIVVDDLFMEFGDYVFVRKALTRFIDEELRPGDMVSLVYMSQGSGALRQFTSDARLLHRAVDRMYWRPPTGVATFLGDLPLVQELRHILLEMGAFPGRKSMVLVAPGTRNTSALDVRGLADLANRTSVTIYTIDARGLPAVPPGFDISVSQPRLRPTAPSSAWGAYRSSQDTLSLLAAATGGLFLHESNATFDQLREAADTGGYYLIGWYPGQGAFQGDPKRATDYHRLQVRLKDKKLHVRSREGYFARVGTMAPRPVFSAREQMRQALVSPFRSGDLDVRLTAGFVRQEAAGSYVDLQMHITPKGVRFEQDARGCLVARLEVLRAVWPVDPGLTPGDRVNAQMMDLSACGQMAERVRRDGVVTIVRERVPSPGAYQVRIAVRNAEAQDKFSIGPQTLERREGTEPVKIPLGSATQFLVIPDLAKKAPTVSSVMLWSGSPPAAATSEPTYRPPSDGDPAVRRFSAGDEVRYSFRVFGNPEETRLRVVHDGQEVWSNVERPGKDGAVAGLLPLKGLAADNYVLHVSAIRGKGKQDRADQFLDFEVR